MNQPIEIVHLESKGFNEFGAASRNTESYIKLSTSLRRGALAFFSGSQLKVFLCIALHEADDEPGASLSTIIKETGIKARQTVIDALAFLSDANHPFIRQDGTEPDGTKRYRVCAFAWFGNDLGRGGKKILPPTKNIFFAQRTAVVGTSTPEPEKNVPTATAPGAATPKNILPSRSQDEIMRIADALWDLDLRDEEAVDEILGYAHVTPEYVEDWVQHRRMNVKSRTRGWLDDHDEVEYALGAGYYRMQIREKRTSPYAMSARQREEYRKHNDEAWEKSQMAHPDKDG